ncbi:uncharacterized protein C3orf38 homolog [Palaemon carinicauda]|uniref:uncharacterized protein C3orf38 homolog n=1 Tax=Palaemon carinicauda TaxID=392227 RepID=UPI0035B66268
MMSLLCTPFEPYLRDFLNYLGQETVLALARVATNNRIVPTTTDEAIEAILLHTPDLARLFSYKRVRSQSLFQYLHKYGVPTERSASKTELVMAVQGFWCQQVQNKSIPNPPLAKRRASDPSSSSNEVKEVSSHQSEDTYTEGRVSAKRRLHREGPAGRSLSESSSTICLADSPVKVLCRTQCDNVNIVPSSTLITKTVRSDKFSKDFCEWYYTMMNRLQPECAHHSGDNFGEKVFFNNSSVDVFLIGQVSEEKHSQGSANNFSLLSDVCRQFRLLFSPNLESGTQAQKSAHGMVKILSCGTLFQSGSFIGIFEQEFGLLICPVDRVWKIMYTKVNLKQTGTEQPLPSLPQCQVFEIEDV